MATKKPTEKRSAHLDSVIGGITSLWFGATVKNRETCEKGFDLQPHAAMCLALMTTKSLASTDSISYQLSQYTFERVESYIVAEYGFDSLMKAGLVKLDAQGKKEYALARASREYGSSGVHWTLTHAGAKRAAPFYCASIGKPSEYQKQAIVEMLAANKATIQRIRDSGKKAEEAETKRSAAAKAKVSPVKKSVKRKVA
nr:hypothetical protein [uncultured Rhodoferax sp.]